MKLQKNLALCLANLTLFSTTAFANPPSNREPNLHDAVMHNNRETVEFLLTHGADPDIPNNHNFPLLHLAIGLNNINIVQLLLDHGADPNIQNNYGTTPLHMAIGLSNINIVQLLLDHGADPNMSNNNNATPFHLAIGLNYINIVQLLRTHGGDPNIRNNRVRQQDVENHPHVEELPQDEFRNSFAQNETRQCPVCLLEFNANNLCCIFNCDPADDYPFGHYLCNDCAQILLNKDRSRTVCPFCHKSLKTH